MKLIVAFAAAAVLITPSYATSCRNAKGKFIKVRAGNSRQADPLQSCER